jgi:phosphohistidine phosphatase SixA
MRAEIMGTRQTMHLSTPPVIALLCAFICTLFSASGFAQSPPAGTPDFQTTAATSKTLEQLRGGGFVLYMRHGYTDNTKPDLPNLDLNDCSTQRTLSQEGRDLAATVGKNIRKAKIPYIEVFSSPLCRAKESAKLAFGDSVKIDHNLMYTSNLTTEEKKPILVSTRRLISQPVPKGENRIVVAHAPNLFDLMGYFVKPEGTVVVLRPLGNDEFEYVASITPSAWAELLKTKR